MVQSIAGSQAAPKGKTGQTQKTKQSTPAAPAPAPAPIDPAKPVDDEILGFLRGGVITPRGVIRVGDELAFEGERQKVKSVDVLRGVVTLSSGKKIQK